MSAVKGIGIDSPHDVRVGRVSLELTREALIASLYHKATGSCCEPPRGIGAKEVADAIRLHHLTDVQSGLRHDGKGCTFARAFEIVMGERLTLGRGK